MHPRSDRLILGDNALVMASLLQDLEGRLDLIYVDPPFFTNRRYPARIGRGRTLAALQTGRSGRATRTIGLILIPISSSSTGAWR